MCFQILNIWYIRRIDFFWRHEDIIQTRSTVFFLYNSVKSEVSDIIDSEENRSEIYKFFVKSFNLNFW
jgi:hypothetical protein